MAYTALYRRFRPAEFESVKGQEHIVTTLKNQLKANRVGHAYLFCGTRGTGKTTVAKIFAKAVNCENPIDGSPCEGCLSCRAITSGSSTNVIEIDAASNNSVDNIREIREEVAYRPTEGKYKVYIIDEVHMLSAGAFNALLKTLEEPPEYVIFILATTESAKIPVTILSRCQRYDFRRMSVETIALRLRELLDKEAIKADEEGIRYIARLADGSMRDSLSLLEQCISCYIGEELTYERILRVLGTADTGRLYGLLKSVKDGDVNSCIRALNDFIKDGKEISRFASDFIWYLRNLLLVKNADGLEDILDMSSENIAELKKIGADMDNDTIMSYIRIFSELNSTLRNVTQKRIHVEMALIQLCRPQMKTDNSAILQRLRTVEDKIENGALSNTKEVVYIEKPKEAQKKEEKKLIKKAAPEELVKICQNWRRITGEINGPVLRSYLDKSEIKYNGATGESKLYIVVSDETDFEYLKKEDYREEIKLAIEKTANRAVDIEIVKKNNNKELAEIPIMQKVQEMVNMPVELE